MRTATNLDRRSFVQGVGTLLVGFSVLRPTTAFAGAGVTAAAPGRFTAYIEIGLDGRVRLTSPVSELGQGTHTAHAAIIADEIGLDIAQVSVEVGRPEPAMRRLNPAFPKAPPAQSTGGSWGVRWWYEPLRKAAAQSREMLIGAAAESWTVDPSLITLENGMLRSGSRSASIGEFAALAAGRAPPDNPALKPISARRYQGTRLNRPDIEGKSRGAPIYTSDFTRPGMIYACARLSPVFGGKLDTFDKASATKVKGVTDVIAIPGGAAVLATNSWAAMPGAAALSIAFKATSHDGLNSAAISAAMRAALDSSKSAMARDDGDWDAALAGAARTVSADYEVPYLAHGTMEPFNCVLEIEGDKVHVWSGTQGQDRVINGLARDHKLASENIIVHTLMAGGGFGRRLRDEEAFSGAYIIAKATGKPVKLFWTREDEMAQGWYRPAQVARMAAALDSEGRMTGLRIRTAGPSMRMDFAPGSIQEGGLDDSSVQSLKDTRYRPGAYRLDYVMQRQPIPTAPWTAVGSTQCGYFIECFLDEVAAAAKVDPYEFRRRLLSHDKRALTVIDLAAEKAGWGKPLPEGRAHGIAYVESYGSLCAQVAEVSLVEGRPKVHRMVVALDCGDVITPDGATAQVEGRVIQGVAAALVEMMTIENGRAVETNYDSYPVVRMPDVPVIETHFIRSGEKLGGIGEPPLPPATPAIVNAVAKLMGRPIRRLPISEALKA